MVKRDWLENMFLDGIVKAKLEIQDTEEDAEKISQAVIEVMPKLIEIYDNHLRTKSNKILKQHQKEISRFKKNLEKKWGKAFDQLELFISFNLEYGVTVAESY